MRFIFIVLSISPYKLLSAALTDQAFKFKIKKNTKFSGDLLSYPLTHQYEPVYWKFAHKPPSRGEKPGRQAGSRT